MEKVIWVRSNMRTLGTKEDDGLDVINKYLKEGWKVKHISACAMGDSIIAGQAYIVIEKRHWLMYPRMSTMYYLYYA